MSDIEFIDVEQGSDEWLELRRSHFTASEAPVIMGVSPYKTMEKLLYEKKTGFVAEFCENTKELFARGHLYEKMARDKLNDGCHDFVPCVAVRKVNNLPLLASLDGLEKETGTVFEHKLFNAKKAAVINDGGLPEDIGWQVLQQMIVTDASRVLVVFSDNNHWVEREYTYKHVDELLGGDAYNRLIAGWKSFDERLEKMKPDAGRDIDRIATINEKISKLKKEKEELIKSIEPFTFGFSHMFVVKESSGGIDYKKAALDAGFTDEELEKYRKKPVKRNMLVKVR